MEKKERKAIATEIFEGNDKLTELHVCGDGQAFTNDNSALNHEKEYTEKRSLTDAELPLKFTRDECIKPKDTDKPVKLNVEQLVAKIGEAKTAEEVDEIVGSDNRATVTKAAEAKKAELAGE